MRQELKAMYDLLLEQKQVQEGLIKLSYEKRQVILNNDTARLSDIVAQEQKDIVKMNSIDKQRVRLIPGIAGALGVPEAEVTLSVIIDGAGPDERNEFFLLQKELTSLINSQLELNKMNKDLLEAHLEYADAMLSVIAEPEDPLNNFYGDDGRANNDKKPTGFIDRQI